VRGEGSLSDDSEGEVEGGDPRHGTQHRPRTPTRPVGPPTWTAPFPLGGVAGRGGATTAGFRSTYSLSAAFDRGHGGAAAGSRSPTGLEGGSFRR